MRTRGWKKRASSTCCCQRRRSVWANGENAYGGLLLFGQLTGHACLRQSAQRRHSHTMFRWVAMAVPRLNNMTNNLDSANNLQSAACCVLCSPDHVQLVIVHGRPLFFAQRDGPWLPTLRLLHQYPDMMTKLQSDLGAIKFVLQGANIMCPGLTSPGASMPSQV